MTERRGSHARVSGGFRRWLGQTVAFAFIFAIAAMLVVAVLIPRIGGATPYTVLTGSMTPTYPPGTLVVVKPTDPTDIGVGSVVTYQLESGEPAVATHRVVTVTNYRGEPLFRTQGDANAEPDREWVQPVQIKGKLWYSVPYLGYVNNLLTGRERQIAVYLIAALLLGYSAYMFTSSLRDGRAGRRSMSPEEVKT